MSKIEEYRSALRKRTLWDPYLVEESRLPGPRANLELAFAVALEGDASLFARYAKLGEDKAPKNSPEEFLAFCGVLGLGYSLAAGRAEHLPQLKEAAKDRRWRIREAVALGLQQYGRVDFGGLMAVAKEWSKEGLLERRAAVAAVCEPDLLKDSDRAKAVFDLLDDITGSIAQVQEAKSEELKALRKTLGYGWSVAVAAQPATGKGRMERWIGVRDGHIRWIMTQNLKKKRLVRMDAKWVNDQLDRLADLAAAR